MSRGLGDVYKRQLLNSWPKGFATDRYNFIMRNELVPQSITILENLGFKSRNGVFYG